MAKNCSNVTIYRYAPPAEPGARVRWWDADAGPHLDPLEWSGPADFNGFPLPSATPPVFDEIVNLTNINDNNTSGAARRYGILSAVFKIPDDAKFIREVNGNSGELGMVLYAPCCSSILKEAPGGNHETNTAGGAASGIMNATPVTGGFLEVYSPQSDLSAFQGWQFQYSSGDETGPWAAITEMCPEYPDVECIEDHPACDPIPEGWGVKPLTKCCPAQYIATGGGGLDEAAVLALIGPHVEPATTVPIPDNEADAAIRTGQVGTSALYARADHNHPIRRQANPGTPTPVLSGPATETFSQFRRFRSTEEWVRFSWRMRFAADTANGWMIYTIPAITGFQVPILHCHGVYLQTGDQDDTGKQVATMDANATDWADISRLYYGQFSAKETSETWWPNVHATYVRL